MNYSDNLFYEKNQKKSISLSVYCDEIKDGEIRNNYCGNQKWNYIGLLIVPIDNYNKLLENLSIKRCGNNPPRNWIECKENCKYHNKNGVEVHYQELNSNDKYFISEKWINYLLTEDKNLTYFYILGINLTNLNNTFFGKENRHSLRSKIIYNRFFRMSLLKSVKKYFYKYDEIIIENIYHDSESSLENDDIFPTYNLKKINNEDPKIYIKCDKIEFLDSDHNKSKNYNSHFIQYIDLILGLCFNCLHWTSKDSNKEKLSEKILPLLKRMMTSPNNKNSSFNYSNRLEIDFFPKHKISNKNSINREIKHFDSFYKIRELEIEKKYSDNLF